MKVEPKVGSKVSLISPEVTLCMNPDHRGSSMVFRTISFIVATGKDGTIDVYSLGGERMRVFQGHSVSVLNMLHLLEDIVVSLNKHGNIIT